MLSNLTVYEHLSRQLANAAGCVLVAVEYQLAPEARFPSQVEACYEATVWAAAQAAEWQADGSRIIVAGDSAGGNLAAAVALLARDRQAPQIDYQLLIYPVTDCRFDTESYLANAEGYLLTRAAMQWFWENYLPEVAAAENPLASPLRAEDLAGLPYTDLITAEYDPLRDEGEAYAHKLTAAGVPVRLERFEGMIHGFVRWTDVFTRAHAAIAEMGQRIRAHFGLPDAVPVPLQNS